MAKSSTTLGGGDNLPARGKSNKTRILEAMRAVAFEGLTGASTKEECEIAFFKSVVKRASNVDDKDSAQMIKVLADKGWASVKPVMDMVAFEYPENGTITQRANAILKAVADGLLAPDVGLSLLSGMEKASTIEANSELKDRIEKLEALING
tara:strand:- start:42 stop:497 length:456 start_codon:yes stop_codon:yes gene_type:complete